MSFYKEVPGLKTTLESTLKFDTTPTAGSTNPVTSGGIASAITEAVGGASDALQEQIDDIAEKAGSGYTPKGPASVATLNGLTGQENGWLYVLTDAGTLTDGSLAVVAGDTVAWDATNSVWYKAMDYAPRQYGTNEVHNLPTTITAFRTGDVIPVDGPSGTAKMSKDDLLKETAENVYPDLLATFCDGVVTGKMPFVRKALESDGDEVSSTTRVMADGVYDDVLIALPEGFVVHSVAYYSSYTDATHFVLDSFSAVGTRLARLKKTGCVLKFTIRKDDSSEILVSDVEEFAQKYASVSLEQVDDLKDEVDDLKDEVDDLFEEKIISKTISVTAGESAETTFEGLHLKEGTYFKVVFNGDVFKNGLTVQFKKNSVIQALTCICSGGWVPIKSSVADCDSIYLGIGGSAVYSTGDLDIDLVFSAVPAAEERVCGSFETKPLNIPFRDGVYFAPAFYGIGTNSNASWSGSIVPIREYAGLSIRAFFKDPSNAGAKTFFVDKDLNLINNITNEGTLEEFAIPANAAFLVVSNRSSDLAKPFFYVVGNVKKNKYIHFSLDDVTGILQNLVDNEATYTSIFDEPKLALLKQWHDAYGIKVSFFVQRTMSDIPAKFKHEFVANKNWMRFGYHGQSNNLATANYEQAKTLWNTFVDGLMTSLNDYDLVDRCPRLDYFHCTLEGAKGLRDAKCGIVGLLSCDDWAYNKEVRATNYYLTDERSTWLDKQDRWVDNENQLTIIKTDFRMEQIVSRWGSTANCIADYSSADRAGEAFYLEIFSHENVFAQFTTETPTIFEWALKSGYKFEFPMDVILGVV